MDSRLQRSIERFVANPGDVMAFEALEEHHFLHAEWWELVRLYERRLEAEDLESRPSDAAQLRFRLGQILEERCSQTDRALESYREVARVDPTFRPALIRLRELYTERSQWDLVLQIAELEAEQVMSPAERAALFAELGGVWLGPMDDPAQGLQHFENALAADPHHATALSGAASAQERLGDPARSAQFLERLLEHDAERAGAEPMVALARLLTGPLGDARRGEALMQQALARDPNNAIALEAICETTMAAGDWEQAAELLERRFGLAAGAHQRLPIARLGGRLHLEHLDDLPRARMWLGRALQLAPGDSEALLELAKLERRAGNPDALADVLGQIAGGSAEPPRELLLEWAALADDRGDPAAAANALRRLHEAAPDEPEIMDRLARVLRQTGCEGELRALTERRIEIAADGPARAAALVELAALQSRAGEAQAAEAALARALESDPGCDEAVEALAHHHAEAGRREELIAHVERSVGQVGRRRALRLHTLLGELLLSRFEDAAAAGDAFRAALELDASDPSALRGLEHVALRSGDDEAILEAFEREAAVTTDRDRLAFLVWELVRILEERDQPEEALLWLERLTAAAPDDREVIATCARLHEQLDHDLELIENLERLDPLLEEGGARAGNQRRLGEIHAKRGDDVAALNAYRRALDADPDDATALRALIAPLERTGRADQLAEAYAHLAQLVPASERVQLLDARVRLFEGPLGDPAAAAIALEDLARVDGAPADVEDRLAEALTRAKRFDSLLARLASRREALDAASHEAAELDRRRLALLLEHLDRPADAAALAATLRSHDALDTAAREAVTDQLESALRRSNASTELAVLLGEREATTDEPGLRAARQLERAGLLETLPNEGEACRALYAELADGESVHAAEAAQHLERLLLEAGCFGELRGRLEGRLQDLLDGRIAGAPADPAQDEERSLRERLSELCAEKLDDRASAIAHLEAACALTPERADLWQGLARLQEAAADEEALLAALEGELAHSQPEPSRELHLRRRVATLQRDVRNDTEAAAEQTRRILALAPGDAAAAEFLIGHLEDQCAYTELLELLQARLERTLGPDSDRQSDATALRLRIAAVQAGELADPDGAIATLEAASEDDAALALVAEPLADCYQRTGRRAELEALCRRAREVCDTPTERAIWTLRRADALNAEGRAHEAAECYREALLGRPEDAHIRSALCHLYRQLGEDERLAELLCSELADVGGGSEVPLRVELAGILERGDQLDDALVQLRRVLELAPGHGEALTRAVAIAERLGRHEDRLSLLETRLARTRAPAERARTLQEQATILAGPLARPQEAVARLHDALALTPLDLDARRALRALLTEASDWSGVLEALEQEAGLLDHAARSACLEEGAEIAERTGEPDAALPWLDRLRAAQPENVSILGRIADLHRSAERFEPLAAGLREQAMLSSAPDERRALLIECATILADRLDAPGRAIAALEAAREAAPGDPEVLRLLADHLQRAGRTAAAADALEEIAEVAEGAERIVRLRDVARLTLDSCDDPRRAAEAAWKALTSPDISAVARSELLRSLARAFERFGRSDLWARAARAELDSLDAGEPVFDERRYELHRDLARAYAGPLARPDRALPHWQALLDWPEDATTDAPVREEAEAAVLDGLRSLREDIELERRLRERLSEQERPAGEWLELGRLCEERLHRHGHAADAYREVLLRDADCLEAIRGLRRCAERLGDMGEVARSLDLEIDMGCTPDAAARAALHRRLGEIAWHALDSTTRASRAFASALEADPRDLVSLRSLQALFETMEDWRGALEMLESEIELLGDAEPERRQEIWLRVGELARDFEQDLPRALRGFEAAAAVGDLPPARRFEWAELYDRLGDPERFAEVFTRFCDDPDAEVSAPDLLRLAAALECLDRPEEARARAERATEVDRHSGAAWDEVARLREAAGELAGAAGALEESARCQVGGAAAERLLRAAGLLEATDLAAAAGVLERAVENDAGNAACHAALARVAHALGRSDKAEYAAVRCLELVGSGGALDREVRLTAALCGAEAAQESRHLDRAVWLYRSALELEPEHAKARSGLAESLFAAGDMEAAREALELRLAESQYAERAGHLLLHAEALDALGEEALALERFREALEAAPELDGAHAGSIAILERSGRRDEAVDGLQRWAALSDDPLSRGERLLRAARLELEDGERSEPAEALLREAVSVHPAGAEAWRRLAELLASAARDDEALSVASDALDAIAGDAPERAPLCRIRAAALEQRGDRSAAALAYRDAALCDPSDSASALAGARLLRALGEWSAAGELLAGFVEAHPARAGADGSADESGLGQAWHQLGRLRAGPLEDVTGAVEAYRRALEVDPSLGDAGEALAQLLTHVPECWDEAIERHRTLLERDPTRVASLRSVVRIAQGRGNDAALATGTAVLRALGVASLEERRDAPARTALLGDRRAVLRDPLYECARQVALEAAREIGDSLEVGAPSGKARTEGADPVAAFRAAVVDAEAQLGAPALVPLSASEVGEVLVLVAQLASEVEGVHGDGNLVNRLAQQLGRRVRRRVRRALGDYGPEQLAEIDFEAWRAELRALASAVVLDQTEVSLRDALIAWLRPANDGDAPPPHEEADISQAVCHCAEALALLRRTVDDWLRML